VASVDDHKKGDYLCTQRHAHPSRSSGSKVNMLEIKQVRQTTMERQGFVSRSSLPTKERLRLRGEACKGNFPQQVGSLLTAFFLFH
jgi:hypothetical protein